MNNHFFIGYAGNKRQEVKLIFEKIKDDINDKEFIIEPFCGTSALSYYISLQYPNKYKYILNDNNPFLIQLYNSCKDDNLLNDICNKLNDVYDISQNKEDYLKVVEKSKTDFISWLYINLVYNMRPGLFPPKNRLIKKERLSKIKHSPIINFLKKENIIISCGNWDDIFNEFKNNNKAFIFFDPPYLSSCNEYYMCPKINIYEYFNDNNIAQFKAVIYFCLENIWIIKLLFKGYEYIIYDKRYEPTKKKTSHILIKNKLNKNYLNIKNNI